MKHEIDLKGYKVRTDLLSEILDREIKDYKRDIKIGRASCRERV